MLFAKNKTHSVAAIGESALIQRIQGWLKTTTPRAPHGIGDDCAVIEVLAPTQQLITTDALSFGQHFDSNVSAEDAGAKLIKRNLSDIAAMGGKPDHAVLALLCAPDTAIDWLESFFAGIRKTCEAYDLRIVGGDVSTLPIGQFSAVLTLVGTIDTAKLRSSAHIGDHIYVTGALGGSILNKHYTFTPRLNEGAWLAQHPSCSALMDLTDGLAKDLKALLPNDASAHLDLNAIPIAEDARKLAESSQRSPLEHAFCDGEDYELLFTVNESTASADFEQEWQQAFPKLRLSRLGRIAHGSKPSPGLINAATNEALPWVDGFEHLKA
ncbi:MAG: thiamine-phosphate kinase [Opitutaceae bacterium]